MPEFLQSFLGSATAAVLVLAGMWVFRSGMESWVARQLHVHGVVFSNLHQKRIEAAEQIHHAAIEADGDLGEIVQLFRRGAQPDKESRERVMETINTFWRAAKKNSMWLSDAVQEQANEMAAVMSHLVYDVELLTEARELRRPISDKENHRMTKAMVELADFRAALETELRRLISGEK